MPTHFQCVVIRWYLHPLSWPWSICSGRYPLGLPYLLIGRSLRQLLFYLRAKEHKLDIGIGVSEPTMLQHVRKESKIMTTLHMTMEFLALRSLLELINSGHLQPLM